MAGTHYHTTSTAGCPACRSASVPIPARILLKCIVQFRPDQSWEGEYGFDWLRIGGPADQAGEDIYTGVIAGGVKTVEFESNGTFSVKMVVKEEYRHSVIPPEIITEDYAALKKMYGTIPIEIPNGPDNLKEYFVTYLNLYPKSKLRRWELSQGPGSRKFKAVLSITIAVNSPAPVKIELEYDQKDKKLFELKYSFSARDLAVGALRKSAGKLEISCLEEFSSDQEIRVMAYPEGWKNKSDATLVGKMIVGKNDEETRKQVKIVLVKVKTKIKNTVSKGEFGPIGKVNLEELTKLSDVLHQALVDPIIDDGPDLDLTEDVNFKITKNAFGGDRYGKFIFEDPDPTLNVFTDGGLFQDYKDDEMYSYLEDQFYNSATNPFATENKRKYNNHFTIFSFGDLNYNMVLNPNPDRSSKTISGRVEDINKQNVFVFPKRSKTTLSHEVLHGFDLLHIHKDGKLDPRCLFAFDKFTTSNIMSYNNPRMSTWRWQWKHMRENLKK